METNERKLQDFQRYFTKLYGRQTPEEQQQQRNSTGGGGGAMADRMGTNSHNPYNNGPHYPLRGSNASGGVGTNATGTGVGGIRPTSAMVALLHVVQETTSKGADKNGGEVVTSLKTAFKKNNANGEGSFLERDQLEQQQYALLNLFSTKKGTSGGGGGRGAAGQSMSLAGGSGGASLTADSFFTGSLFETSRDKSDRQLASAFRFINPPTSFKAIMKEDDTTATGSNARIGSEHQRNIELLTEAMMEIATRHLSGLMEVAPSISGDMENFSLDDAAFLRTLANTKAMSPGASTIGGTKKSSSSRSKSSTKKGGSSGKGGTTSSRSKSGRRGVTKKKTSAASRGGSEGAAAITGDGGGKRSGTQRSKQQPNEVIHVSKKVLLLMNNVCQNAYEAVGDADLSDLYFGGSDNNGGSGGSGGDSIKTNSNWRQLAPLLRLFDPNDPDDVQSKMSSFFGNLEHQFQQHHHSLLNRDDFGLPGAGGSDSNVFDSTGTEPGGGGTEGGQAQRNSITQAGLRDPDKPMSVVPIRTYIDVGTPAAAEHFSTCLSFCDDADDDSDDGSGGGERSSSGSFYDDTDHRRRRHNTRRLPEHELRYYSYYEQVDLVYLMEDVTTAVDRCRREVLLFGGGGGMGNMMGGGIGVGGGSLGTGGDGGIIDRRKSVSMSQPSLTTEATAGGTLPLAAASSNLPFTGGNFQPAGVGGGVGSVSGGGGGGGAEDGSFNASVSVLANTSTAAAMVSDQELLMLLMQEQQLQQQGDFSTSDRLQQHQQERIDAGYQMPPILLPTAATSSSSGAVGGSPGGGCSPLLSVLPVLGGGGGSGGTASAGGGGGASISLASHQALAQHQRISGMAANALSQLNSPSSLIQTFPEEYHSSLVFEGNTIEWNSLWGVWMRFGCGSRSLTFVQNHLHHNSQSDVISDVFVHRHHRYHNAGAGGNPFYHPSSVGAHTGGGGGGGGGGGVNTTSGGGGGSNGSKLPTGPGPGGLATTEEEEEDILMTLMLLMMRHLQQQQLKQRSKAAAAAAHTAGQNQNNNQDEYDDDEEEAQHQQQQQYADAAEALYQQQHQHALRQLFLTFVHNHRRTYSHDHNLFNNSFEYDHSEAGGAGGGGGGSGGGDQNHAHGATTTTTTSSTSGGVHGGSNGNGNNNNTHHLLPLEQQQQEMEMYFNFHCGVGTGGGGGGGGNGTSLISSLLSSYMASFSSTTPGGGIMSGGGVGGSASGTAAAQMAAVVAKVSRGRRLRLLRTNTDSHYYVFVNTNTGRQLSLNLNQLQQMQQQQSVSFTNESTSTPSASSPAAPHHHSGGAADRAGGGVGGLGGLDKSSNNSSIKKGGGGGGGGGGSGSGGDSGEGDMPFAGDLFHRFTGRLEHAAGGMYLEGRCQPFIGNHNYFSQNFPAAITIQNNSQPFIYRSIFNNNNYTPPVVVAAAAPSAAAASGSSSSSSSTASSSSFFSGGSSSNHHKHNIPVPSSALLTYIPASIAIHQHARSQLGSSRLHGSAFRHHHDEFFRRLIDPRQAAAADSSGGGHQYQYNGGHHQHQRPIPTQHHYSSHHTNHNQRHLHSPSSTSTAAAAATGLINYSGTGYHLNESRRHHSIHPWNRCYFNIVCLPGAGGTIEQNEIVVNGTAAGFVSHLQKGSRGGGGGGGGAAGNSYNNNHHGGGNNDGAADDTVDNSSSATTSSSGNSTSGGAAAATLLLEVEGAGGGSGGVGSNGGSSTNGSNATTTQSADPLASSPLPFSGILLHGEQQSGVNTRMTGNVFTSTQQWPPLLVLSSLTTNTSSISKAGGGGREEGVSPFSGGPRCGNNLQNVSSTQMLYHVLNQMITLQHQNNFHHLAISAGVGTQQALTNYILQQRVLHAAIVVDGRHHKAAIEGVDCVGLQCGIYMVNSMVKKQQQLNGRSTHHSSRVLSSFIASPSPLDDVFGQHNGQLQWVHLFRPQLVLMGMAPPSHNSQPQRPPAMLPPPPPTANFIMNIRRCRFVRCLVGVRAMGATIPSIRRSTFTRCAWNGVELMEGSIRGDVSGCTFDGCNLSGILCCGVDIESEISENQFNGNRVGMLITSSPLPSGVVSSSGGGGGGGGTTSSHASRKAAHIMHYYDSVGGAGGSEKSKNSNNQQQQPQMSVNQNHFCSNREAGAIIENNFFNVCMIRNTFVSVPCGAASAASAAAGLSAGCIRGPAPWERSTSSAVGCNELTGIAIRGEGIPPRLTLNVCQGLKFGVKLIPKGGVLMDQNVFELCDYGVMCSTPSESTVLACANVFIQCLVAGWCTDGSASAPTKVFRNAFHNNNRVPGLSSGLVLRPGAGGIYLDNDFSGNSVGISAGQGCQATIKECGFQSNYVAGIDAMESTRIRVEGCYFYQNKVCDILCSNEADPTVASCFFSSTASLMLGPGARGTYHSNAFKECEAAVVCVGAGAALVTENSILACGEGIVAGYMMSASGPRIIGNSILRCRIGVRGVVGGGGVIIERNLIQDSTQHGVLIENGSAIRLEENGIIRLRSTQSAKPILVLVQGTGGACLIRNKINGGAPEVNGVAGLVVVEAPSSSGGGGGGAGAGKRAGPIRLASPHSKKGKRANGSPLDSPGASEPSSPSAKDQGQQRQRDFASVGAVGSKIESSSRHDHNNATNSSSISTANILSLPSWCDALMRLYFLVLSHNHMSLAGGGGGGGGGGAPSGSMENIPDATSSKSKGGGFNKKTGLLTIGGVLARSLHPRRPTHVTRIDAYGSLGVGEAGGDGGGDFKLPSAMTKKPPHHGSNALSLEAMTTGGASSYAYTYAGSKNRMNNNMISGMLSQEQSLQQQAYRQHVFQIRSRAAAAAAGNGRGGGAEDPFDRSVAASGSRPAATSNNSKQSQSAAAAGSLTGGTSAASGSSTAALMAGNSSYINDMLAIERESFASAQKHFAPAYYPSQVHSISENEIYCCRGLNIACMYLKSGEVTVTRNYVYGGDTGIYVGENSRALLTHNISYDHSVLAGLIVGPAAHLANNEWYSPVDGGAIRTAVGVPNSNSPNSKRNANADDDEFGSGSGSGSIGSASFPSAGKDIVGMHFHARMPFSSDCPIFAADLPTEKSGGVINGAAVSALHKFCINNISHSSGRSVTSSSSTGSDHGEFRLSNVSTLHTDVDKYASGTFPPMLKVVFQELLQFPLPFPSLVVEPNAALEPSVSRELAVATLQWTVPSPINASSSAATLETLNANSHDAYNRQVKLFSLDKTLTQVRLEYIRQVVKLMTGTNPAHGGEGGGVDDGAVGGNNKQKTSSSTGGGHRPSRILPTLPSSSATATSPKAKAAASAAKASPSIKPKPPTKGNNKKGAPSSNARKRGAAAATKK